MTALLLALLVLADGPARAAVRARPAATRALVGEGVAVAVEVENAPPGSEIVPPRVNGAEVAGPSGPLGGGPASRTFTVTPTRPGELVVPPFQLRAKSDLVAASPPIRLRVAPVPAEGRPPAFLGGVGRFEVAASVDVPGPVRLGAWVEGRVVVTGPAAWGSTRPPDLLGWSARVPGLRVEARDPEPVAATGGAAPARRFPFRVRPTRPGSWILPPISVAAYDPEARRYVTRATAGLPLAVEAPAPFDPGSIPTTAAPTRSGWPAIRVRTGPWVGAAALGGLAALAVAVGMRIRLRREHDPGRWARDLARRLDPTWDLDRLARAIGGGLAEYLRRRSGRPPGELTPAELEAALRDHDPDLATSARRLLEANDRARFGGPGADPVALVDEARAVLARLADFAGKPAGRSGGADGTVPPPAVAGTVTPGRQPRE